jgi:hypothetical protein
MVILDGKGYQADNDVVESTHSAPFDHSGGTGSFFRTKASPKPGMVLEQQVTCPVCNMKKGREQLTFSHETRTYANITARSTSIGGTLRVSSRAHAPYQQGDSNDPK